jgi:hypothetical protein
MRDIKLKKPTLSYGIIGAAVAVVAIALMVGSASLTAYAQNTTNSTTGTATTANSTNATANATTTELSSSSCTYNTTAAGLDDTMNLQGELAPDRIAGLCAQDPEFARWQGVLDECQGYNLPLGERHRNNATMSYDQCVSTLQNSVDRWCDLAVYQKEKCETAGMQLSTFTGFHDIMEIMGRPGP